VHRPAWLTGLIVLLALPGLAAFLLLGQLVRHPPGAGTLLIWRVACALPAVLTPAAIAALRLQSNQRRAAIGLGAGPLDRLRHLWLPQLGPGLLGSLLLAALLAGAWLWLDG